MRTITCSLLLSICGLVACSDTPTKNEASTNADDITLSQVSPMLANYKSDVLQNELWQRPELSLRDRGLVTVAALIARGQTETLAHYVELALDYEVSPAEVSEIVTHLAFYSGWANAEAAALAIQPVFHSKGISAKDLPSSGPKLLPLDIESEKQREAYVSAQFGEVAPGVVHYTTETLFLNLWLRPALKPRDRSLITVSALVATGKVEQVSFHLNRALDNGLSKAEASEVLTQLAFYAGWPNVFSALPIFKKVLNDR